MISDHISDLITAAKAKPNSLSRNKMVSHLEDAKAHAIVLETFETKPVQGQPKPVPITRYYQSEIIDSNGPQASLCRCPDGAADTACPVHAIAE